MQEKHLFEYAVIRFVPRVEREEFFNVGIILYCAPHNFLQAAFELSPARLQAFGITDIEEIAAHLTAFELICLGGADAGAIGKFPIGARFRWLTAPRSTVLQTSPVHTGLCSDAPEMLRQLLAKLVQ